MAVHIRLARAGTKKTPFYRIVVADKRAARGGRFIERLGTFDPRSNVISLKSDRVKHWRDQGATPSHTVELLLKRPDVAAATAATTATTATTAPAAK